MSWLFPRCAVTKRAAPSPRGWSLSTRQLADRCSARRRHRKPRREPAHPIEVSACKSWSVLLVENPRQRSCSKVTLRHRALARKVVYCILRAEFERRMADLVPDAEAGKDREDCTTEGNRFVLNARLRSVGRRHGNRGRRDAEPLPSRNRQSFAARILERFPERPECRKSRELRDNG
jgi:hypothetical protein